VKPPALGRDTLALKPPSANPKFPEPQVLLSAVLSLRQIPDKSCDEKQVPEIRKALQLFLKRLAIEDYAVFSLVPKLTSYQVSQIKRVSPNMDFGDSRERYSRIVSARTILRKRTAGARLERVTMDTRYQAGKPEPTVQYFSMNALFYVFPTIARGIDKAEAAKILPIIDMYLREAPSEEEISETLAKTLRADQLDYIRINLRLSGFRIMPYAEIRSKVEESVSSNRRTYL